MGQLSKKQQRTIQYFAARIFSAKGLSSDCESDTDFLSSCINLPDGRTTFLTSAGLQALRDIVDLLYSVDLFDADAGYSDLWTAVKDVIRDFLGRGSAPEVAEEFLQPIREKVSAEIQLRTFLVPLIGLELSGRDELPLGAMRAVRPSRTLLNDLGVDDARGDIDKLYEETKGSLWLMGSVVGTAKIAHEKFRELAHLTTGVVSIVAGSMYGSGSHKFRIGTVMTPEEAYGRAMYLSWSDKDPTLAVHYQFMRGHPVPIDEDLSVILAKGTIPIRMFSLLQLPERTELDDAIVRAVYWYSDAHRDEVLVMRFLKYWSCIEAFFSIRREDNTKSVAAGLAATLLRSDMEFELPIDYPALKKRVAHLYDVRSSATHDALHRHVSQRDVADLSQWVAWMIAIVTNFTIRGMRTRSRTAELGNEY